MIKAHWYITSDHETENCKQLHYLDCAMKLKLFRVGVQILNEVKETGKEGEIDIKKANIK